jgi:hypothetical protein
MADPIPIALEDFIVVFCKGRCGTFVPITLSNLRRVLYQAGMKSLKEFSESYICIQCHQAFAKLANDVAETTKLPDIAEHEPSKPS